jgi:hypothetical protein
MIRIICREEPPHSSVPFVYKTFDVDFPDLEEWLTGTWFSGQRCALGVEILPKIIPLIGHGPQTPEPSVVDAEFKDPEVDRPATGEPDDTCL